MNTQNPNNVFVFDMDNTLIKTDKANNLAYSEAIRSVLSVNCNIENGKRFTRNELKDLFPQLTQTQIDEIIDRKEKSFESYLNETELNNNLFSILKCLHQEGHHTILLTNCHSGRAISLCNFYDLTKYFVRRFFYEDCLGNKYTLLKSLGYDLQNVVLYENEEVSSSEAVTNGINLDKIVKVKF
ncbi:HAD family hydrolase [Bacteroides faecis]|jgi:phosphoglycolate phosphatase-like HAD superfamily hydrolase|uniref:HAD family hydrolase n=1 Tax=Bacteroides faecis TaxID=674529 RepID=UPI000D64BA4B|nr:HAD family hydrolase [Bacteroides faecis]KAA5266337.1 HAD family hydrolase [Bacteroides faecis]MCB6632705.1 HAD family hydrolase [Bacteroides faecis]MCE8942745.1 HAD family hydrolase [Bacteroides faecis]MCE9011557.1 HAD family hydrolase [Bacteroides faecis]MCS2650612.1 HAD family hydrolase [Bacteroides faecis]